MRNKPKRQCGSCEYWVKLHGDKWGRGLCTLLDLAGPPNYGNNCHKWKGKSYIREQNKKDTHARIVQW